jgi:hypothetical protein
MFDRCSAGFDKRQLRRHPGIAHACGYLPIAPCGLRAHCSRLADRLTLINPVERTEPFDHPDRMFEMAFGLRLTPLAKR